MWFYTIGQRRQLGLSGKNPYYVIGKDVEENNLLVVEGDDAQLYSEYCVVKRVNWLVNDEEKERVLSEKKEKVTAKFRYRQTEIEIVIKKKKKIVMN